jgi:hypothetical protein
MVKSGEELGEFHGSEGIGLCAHLSIERQLIVSYILVLVAIDMLGEHRKSIRLYTAIPASHYQCRAALYLARANFRKEVCFFRRPWLSKRTLRVPDMGLLQNWKVS